MTTTGDPDVTDPRTLADRLDQEADFIDSCGQRHRPWADDLRAAARLLRHHANLTDTIANPDGLRLWAEWCEAECLDMHGTIGDPDGLRAWVEDEITLRRIADAATHQEGT